LSKKKKRRALPFGLLLRGKRGSQSTKEGKKGVCEWDVLEERKRWSGLGASRPQKEPRGPLHPEEKGGERKPPSPRGKKKIKSPLRGGGHTKNCEEGEEKNGRRFYLPTAGRKKGEGGSWSGAETALFQEKEKKKR